MAGETTLRDARITVRIDVEKALDDTKGADSPGEQSSPGRRPPDPGKVNEQDKKDERDNDDRRPNPRPGPRPGGTSSGGRGGGIPGLGGVRMLANMVKVLAAAEVASIVADIVPGLIKNAIDTTDSTDGKQLATLKLLEASIGMTLEKLSVVLRGAEAMLPILPAMLGGAMDVATANQIMGLGISDERIFDIALRQGASASAAKSMSLAFRKRKREALGVAARNAIQDTVIPKIKQVATKALFENAATNR